MLGFVTFADENYFDWIDLWLKSLNRSNPDAKIFIYDISSSPTGMYKALAASFPNVVVVDWPPSRWRPPAWIDETDFSFFWPGFNLRDEIKSLSRRLRFWVTGKKKNDWMIDKPAFVKSKQFFIKVCCEKPRIILDAWSRAKMPLAYIDADAMVLSRLPDYPVNGHDALVAVVDRDQFRIGGEWEPTGPDGDLPISLINAGVVFVNNTLGAEFFLNAWIAELSRVRHGAADQTALANLLYRHDQNFHHELTPIRFKALDKQSDVQVGCVACAEFNQVRISPEWEVIDEVSHIAHFVGSWKQDEHWPTVCRLVENTLVRRSFGEGVEVS